jgi:hypothetical protein
VEGPLAVALLVSTLLTWGKLKPPTQGVRAAAAGCFVGATPAGTGDAHLPLVQRPTLWRVQVALDRRNARQAVGWPKRAGLRYVLIPRETVAVLTSSEFTKQNGGAPQGAPVHEMPDTMRIDRLRALS